MSGKEFVKKAKKAGWQLERVNGSHHILKHPEKSDLLSVPVHGNKDLKKGIYSRLKKIAGL